MSTQPGFISADYKVPGGKLLRARLHIEAHTITRIMLTGDFFMHPEHALEDLETRLTAIPLDANVIRAQVQAFFETDVQVIGAGVEDFVSVIMKANEEEIT